MLKRQNYPREKLWGIGVGAGLGSLIGLSLMPEPVVVMGIPVWVGLVGAFLGGLLGALGGAFVGRARVEKHHQG